MWISDWKNIFPSSAFKVMKTAPSLLDGENLCSNYFHNKKALPLYYKSYIRLDPKLFII